MSRLTYAQRHSFAETVVQFIKDNVEELKNIGFDPASVIAEMEKNIDATVKLDVQQETLKAELVKTTKEAVEQLYTTYRQASSMIDAMVGLLGKGTALSKRLRKLRDQMVVVALRGKRVPAS